MNRAEELKAIAKISPPDPVVPYTNFNVALAEDIRREMDKGPMRVVSGVPLPPRNGRPGTKPAGDPEDLLEKTDHVRFRNERVIQLIARTGISPVQIRAWTKDRIREFCAIALVNDDDGGRPRGIPMG